eukprot:353906-Chlamydomonas_euryale.AAC.1
MGCAKHRCNAIQWQVVHAPFGGMVRSVTVGEGIRLWPMCRSAQRDWWWLASSRSCHDHLASKVSHEGTPSGCAPPSLPILATRMQHADTLRPLTSTSTAAAAACTATAAASLIATSSASAAAAAAAAAALVAAAASSASAAAAL